MAEQIRSGVALLKRSRTCDLSELNLYVHCIGRLVYCFSFEEMLSDPVLMSITNAGRARDSALDAATAFFFVCILSNITSWANFSFFLTTISNWLLSNQHSHRSSTGLFFSDEPWYPTMPAAIAASWLQSASHIPDSTVASCWAMAALKSGPLLPAVL